MVTVIVKPMQRCNENMYLPNNTATPAVCYSDTA